jgi:DNA repair protein RadC
VTNDLTLVGGERPLDRLYRAGAQSLSDAELVSLLLDRCVSEAAMLVRNGLPAFARLPWDTPKPRVTRRQASRVIASLELTRRLASATSDEREPITHADMVGRRLRARYAHHVQEVLGAVYLDAKHRVIRDREIYVGTVNSAVVSTRDVLRHALDDHAAAVIVFHNHPSGDPEPSPEDLAFTRKLVEAGKALGIDILDHLILGSSRVVSLKERRVM